MEEMNAQYTSTLETSLTSDLKEKKSEQTKTKKKLFMHFPFNSGKKNKHQSKQRRKE